MDKPGGIKLEGDVSEATRMKLTIKAQEEDPLRACVHCGLCLESCPTYRLTGDENNSPRGRLLLWRAEEEGRLEPDEWTDHYTDECVGCLACQSVCPANVPYDLILERTRHRHHQEGRTSIRLLVRLAAWAVRWRRWFNLALTGGRLLRWTALRVHPMVFPGRPPVLKTTAAYASELMAQSRPTGPKVAFLTGCLMEGLFREINFATVRVLVRHGYRVYVPPGQGCCGALHEHTGMDGVESMFAVNRRAFKEAAPDKVVSNSSGCGLALSKALGGALPVYDLTTLLAEASPRPAPKRDSRVSVFVDIPCHLVHGRQQRIPESVLDATGYAWEWAPMAEDCCGSGGVYNLQKPENARRILEAKARFLNALPAECLPVVATSNHVCMMQWFTARRFIERPFAVCHVAQLLDEEIPDVLRTTFRL